MRELAAADEENLSQSIAWVVMPDHLHWVFALLAPALGKVVGRVKGRSSRHWQARHGANTPLWQPGFYDHRMQHDEDLFGQLRYLLANPVRAGLVARPSQYPFVWCKHGLDL